MTIDFEGDAKDQARAPIDLERITALAQLMRAQEAAVAAAEADLNAAKARLRKTQCEDLPELMREVGLEEAKLLDGWKLTVTQEVQAGVAAERMPRAVAWLTKNKFDGIVKTEVSVQFGRGQEPLARKVAGLIAKAAPEQEAVLRQTIHAQTLQAFVKECMRKKIAVPTDLFGVHPYNKAKLKAPKS